MENNVYQIIAENAELESRMLQRFIGVDIVGESAVDFVKGKASVVTNAIKRLYEKIMEMIDELILKVLNVKDKAGLYLVNKMWKDLSYKKIKVKSKWLRDGVSVSDLIKRVDDYVKNMDNVIIQMDSNKDEGRLDTTDAGNISGTYADSESKNAYTEITKSTEGDVNKSNLGNKIYGYFITEVKEETLKDTTFNTIKNFITGSGKDSAIESLSTLRSLKVSVKKSYKTALGKVKESYKEDLKGLKGEDRRDMADSRRLDSQFVKIYFEIYTIVINSMMKITKEYIKIAKVIGKAVKNKGAVKDKSDEEVKKKPKTSETGEEETANASANIADDVDIALMEASLLDL